MAAQCRIEISRRVTRCGFNGITYGSTPTSFSKLIKYKDCQELLKRGQITISRKTYQFTDGVRITDEFISRGSVVDHSGMCWGVHFKGDNGIRYYDSYETTKVDIHIRSINGTRDTDSNNVYFEGIRGHYRNGLVHDGLEGTFDWDVVKDESCSAKLSQVYFGNAWVRRRNGEETLANGIVMVENNKTHQYAGFSLKTAMTI
jgi:hypothetical protein